MDFLDPKQKRSHRIRLYVVYSLMVSVIIFGTYLLANLTSGYYYDAKTNTVVQNGLLFIDSHPESARVSLNGKDKGVTDARLVLPAADYEVVLSREGYRNWQHNVRLEGGSIERLIYPFMFPSNLVSEDADLFASKPSFASQSPDRRWLIVKHPESINNFEIVDINAKSIEPSVLSINPSVINQTGSTHTFKEVEWSTDNRHLLVQHFFESGSEFILIDRENAEEAINLNSRFKRAISDIRLRDKKYDKYYLHDIQTGDLVSAELANEKVALVANRVLDFQPHGNDLVLYAAMQAAADSATVEVKLADGDKHYKLRDIPKSAKYLLDLAQFDGKWYIALGSSEDKKVLLYIDPLKDLKRENQRTPLPSVLLRLNKPIEYMSFSANTRFLSIQSGSSFAVYDAETIRQYKYEVDINMPKEYEAKWMDGHRINAVSGGKMFVFDFDGTNKQELVAAYDEFYPFFDRDYNRLLTVSPSLTVKDKSSLVLTSLRYEPEQNN